MIRIQIKNLFHLKEMFWTKIIGNLKDSQIEKDIDQLSISIQIFKWIKQVRILKFLLLKKF